jgi:hypothetical protein
MYSLLLTGNACFFLTKYNFDKKHLTREVAHRMLTGVGKGIKANILRTLYIKYEQPLERIKDLTSAQVTIHPESHRFQKREQV